MKAMNDDQDGPLLLHFSRLGQLCIGSRVSELIQGIGLALDGWPAASNKLFLQRVHSVLSDRI